MGKKQTTRDQLDQSFEIQGQQQYAKALGPRGNHQHEVELADGTKTLVTLPPRFRNVVWLKRGHYVIIDPTVGVSEKVGGEIVHVLFLKNIKDLKAAGKWPTAFSESSPMTQNEEEEEEENSDDDLFVNNNRPVMSDTDPSSEEED
ncbi:putative RNA-binding protein EIF1AD [Choanephora cucurbitarum]|uniref:Putative RNA-binding protein EIF1AD n=1 Tax=Choanephora cucurbitarum TaxID=101091 RepID=A0A1C7N632_9FUNG|nr:putative RNA-binding protein EIF1AD [Choanephora cucurbitarum]